MEIIDLISPEHLEKTVSFKLSREELSLLKEQCDQEGSTMSDFMRKRIRVLPVPTVEPLQREMQLGFDLQLAQEKVSRLQAELGQTQQAAEVERLKRKKLKKRLAEAEAQVGVLTSQAEGGLSGLVSQHPAIGNLLSDAFVRIATNPNTQKTFGTLMGVAEPGAELSEEDKDLLVFGHELRQKLSSDELSLVVEICYRLIERRGLIRVVLKNLQASVPPKPASPAPTATATKGPAMP